MAKYTSVFKGRLKAYFITRLGMYNYKHGWLKGTCPACNREMKYGVNISRNRTNCFVCGYNKPPLDVAMEIEGIESYHQIVNFLESGKFEGFEFTEEKLELREHKTFYLPDGFKLLNQGESQVAESARAYMKARGFDINTMSYRGWGYCATGSYFGYIIMPFYSNGKLIYYNARNFLSTGPRYNNPTVDITGVGKSVIWYNGDAFRLYKQVYLTEGVFNAETLGERAVSSGGKFVSRYQINGIIKSPVERIVIVLDPDAKDKAIDLALKLVDFKKVKVVFLPDFQDPNSLGRKSTMRFIYNTRYQDRKTLIRMKGEL